MTDLGQRLWREGKSACLVALFFMFPLFMPGASWAQMNVPDPDDNARQPLPAHPIQLIYRIETQAALSGWNDNLHRQAADAWISLGVPDAAASHLAQINDRSTRDLRALAELWLELQNWPRALDVLGEMIDTGPQNTWAHYQRALLLLPSDPLQARLDLDVARLDDAYRDLADALLIIIEEEALNPYISVPLGLELMRQQYWAAAERAFVYASELAYPYPEALAYAALARESQQKDGLAYINIALQLSADSAPGLARVQYLHGLILRGRLDLERSLIAFSEAAALDPTNPAYFAELGEAHRLLADFDLAEYWLLVAVSVSNNAPTFNRLLAQFYATDGAALGSESLETMLTMADSLPQDAEMIAGFASSLYALGDLQAALDQADAALNLDPFNERARFVRARVLIDSGLQQEGLDLLRQLEEGSSSVAEQARAVLESLEE